MRINLQHFNLPSRDGLDRWIEEKVIALGESRRIDEANVRLECRSESSPPFSAWIHLVTPGPDFFAEGCDHTVRAAFTKTLARLREQISSRAGKRVRRLKNKSRTPAPKARSGRLP